jgi:hypothetical protein
MEEYDTLDIKAMADDLSDQEQIRIQEINCEMQKIWLKRSNGQPTFSR